MRRAAERERIEQACHPRYDGPLDRIGSSFDVFAHRCGALDVRSPCRHLLPISHFGDSTEAIETRQRHDCQ